MKFLSPFLLFAFLASVTATARAETDAREGIAFFESRVRPALAKYCYECHSAESGKSKGGLRVDSREALLKGGESGPAVVPRSLEKSLLFQAITSTDKDAQMPPNADLKQRDLLNDTLIIWGGGFGRTPFSPDGNGRDHNHKGYTTWMAGGGVRGGLSYGETDEHGYEAGAGKMHIHDWHATILHLLGLNHEKLTFRHAGREMRLTDVKGNVVTEIIE